MRILVVTLILLVVSCKPVAPATPHAPPNFFLVRPGLYRGGHPDAGGLSYLKNLGVRTIVDLEVADLIEATPAQIREERDGAAARGLAWIHAPMSAFEPASWLRHDAMITSVLNTIAKANGSVYVHCLHGQDRTGLVIGLERVEVEHWEPMRAYNEMLAHGFHPMFVGLRDFFWGRVIGAGE